MGFNRAVTNRLRRKDMRLHELFDIPGELNWTRLNVFEMFATEVPINWSQHNDNLVGAFSVDSTNYLIKIEPGIFNEYTFANIAFCKVDAAGEEEYELTNDTKNPVKVLGAIINGVNRKINEFELDAIIFAASNNVDKRMKFYNKLADKFVKNFGRIIQNVPAGNGKFTVLISSKIPKDDRDAFVDMLKRRNK